MSAHLVSDLVDRAAARKELDAFARSIMLRGDWIQNPGTATEHYDLFGGRIGQARAMGAVEITPRELVERVARPKRAGGMP